ncbi:MAG: CARDB domain-containing protein [Pirellulaceae bacterium]
MTHRNVVLACMLALVGVATWVQGQDKEPTPAGEPPTNRYQDMAREIANEYGTSTPTTPSLLGVQPETNLPSILRRAKPPEGQVNNSGPKRPQTSYRSASRPRPVPTEITPRGVGRTDEPQGIVDSTAAPLAAPTRSRSVVPAPGYAASVAPAATGGQLKLSVRSPQLQLNALGPDAITIGKPAQYRIQLSNLASSDADGIMVRASLPESVVISRLEPAVGVAEKITDEEGSIAWTIDRLKGQQTAVLTVTLIPNADEPIKLNIDWALRPQSVLATIAVQRPDLRIAIDGPDSVLHGESHIFAIRVQNPGTGPARNVELTLSTGDSAPLVKDIGTIGAGKEEVIRVELIAREAGNLDVFASAVSDDLKTESRKEVLVRQAKLEIEVMGPPIKFANTDGGYRVVVSNRGDSAAKDVLVKIKLPVGCRLISASQNAAEQAGHVQWTIPELNPDQDVVFDLKCLFEAAGDQQISAAVKSGLLQSIDTFSTRVEAIADLKMLVNDPTGPRPIGEEVTYEIEITNRGTKAAFNVKVLGQFSSGIEPIRTKGHTSKLLSGQVVFNPIPRIDPGKTVKLTIIAQANKPGNLIFRAAVECLDPETKLSVEDSTRYFGSQVSTTPRPTRVGRNDGPQSR